MPQLPFAFIEFARCRGGVSRVFASDACLPSAFEACDGAVDYGSVIQECVAEVVGAVCGVLGCGLPDFEFVSARERGVEEADPSHGDVGAALKPSASAEGSFDIV